MATINVKDAAGSTVALEKPLAPGQTTMSASRPVAIASDQSAIPVTDNSSSLTVDNAGTFPVQAAITAAAASIADAAIVTLGAKADAKSTATDATAITLMQVSKQISASVQALAAALTTLGQATMSASEPVVIASDQTWGVGSTGFTKLEDAASADGDKGVGILCVRKATPANTSGSDGDYEFPQMSAGSLWTASVATDKTLVSERVINGGSQYETVAANQAAQALGAAGATGDYIAGVLVIPATTSPGNVLLLDNATSITIFAGGSSSVSNLVPFYIPLGLISVSGAWKLTTGSNVSCIGIGRFT